LVYGTSHRYWHVSVPERYCKNIVKCYDTCTAWC
jgi:hypothetical protein